MPSIPFTAEQEQAIGTTGRSVIVSAAAGSGKTAVLAERCAHLVCDLPPRQRCNVDEILVLTFTEAAAAEMRSRIVSAIRARADANPRDERLRDQAMLTDAAPISTIHAFCLWLIRRWFSEVGIDPTAVVLDEDETRLLKIDVLDGVFSELYRAAEKVRGGRSADCESRNGVDAGREEGAPTRERLDHAQGSVRPPRRTGTSEARRTLDGRQHRPLQGVGTEAGDTAGEPASPAAETGPASTGPTPPCEAFVKLVDDYGLGKDREVARFVLRLFDWTVSLPDPDEWLVSAYRLPADRPQELVIALAEELRRELDRQAVHCRQLAATLEAGAAVGRFYAERIRAYGDQLGIWSERLEGREPDGSRDAGASPRQEPSPGAPYDVADEEVRATLLRFDAVRRAIADFEFSRATGPKMPKDAGPATKAALRAARDRFAEVKQRLFLERIRKRFGLFSVEECLQGIRATAPYVKTIVDLVFAFRRAYTARKREMNVLDFADLERFAFELLSGGEGGGQPSDVARTLHRRFAHVLVDEFQDINPIQEAIIRRVSRECDPDRPGNLFVVGDVKQSIYRFRLAEPAIFTERLSRFRGGEGGAEPPTGADSQNATRLDSGGTALSLPHNFRSRPEILDAVNLTFRRLMRSGSGSIVYDAEAALRPGRSLLDSQPGPPIEVHLLERKWNTPADDGESLEPGLADLSDPARWTPTEREAYLIGTRIRNLVDGGASAWAERPLSYRDMVILLRAKRINAERMAAMLTAMGIPAYADVGGSLLGSREGRDVLAALQLLDNVQQDIPLAAVLRSGIFGERCSADELVEIRCLDRDIPFHEVVRCYALRGPDENLRSRLQALLERVDRYRQDVRRRPLADVLWSLYERQRYLAYVGGLPGGTARRANLLKLHELARRFGTFRKQGLHRFLRFLDALADQQQEIAVASAIGEADDVVRIMSIHQAKGLEFPIVFVAALGTRFNLGDRRGRMIFERAAKIALRVVDTERMIEYPTAGHWVAAAEIEQAARDEELRILYVAMTRAQEKLVLVGSEPDIDRHRVSPQIRNAEAPSLFQVATAVTPLDWLMPILTNGAADIVSGLSPAHGDAVGQHGRRSDGDQAATVGARIRSVRPLFDVHLHTVEEMAGWRVADRLDQDEQTTRRAVSRCASLPAREPLAPDDTGVESVLARLEYVYPHLACVSVPASIAASEFKGTYDFLHNPEERPDRPGKHPLLMPLSKDDRFGTGPTRRLNKPSSSSQSDQAVRRGVVTHRILEHLDFSQAVDRQGVALELQRLLAAGVITAEDRDLVDVGSLEWFLGTPLADAIRQAGDAYRREFLFIATEPLEYFDRSVGPAGDDRVLVRGIVDGILPGVNGIEIVDFKTDAVRPGEVADRRERYRPQMDLYARAVARLWRRPVQTCWLVFLSARQLVPVP